MRDAFPSATIIRPSVVFGPEDDFFNRFADLARFTPALPLIDGGETRMQPVYVGDVADAICKALDDDACAGETYELGGPRAMTDQLKLLAHDNVVSEGAKTLTDLGIEPTPVEAVVPRYLGRFRGLQPGAARANPDA